MANSNSPLSYQTTMPEYPDVSYDTWSRTQAADVGSRAFNSLYAWFHNRPNYETWRMNQLDEYNARMSAYNTWLSSGEGIRASAESGGYNPSYFQAGQASASPLNYQDVNPGNGAQEIGEGLSGLLSLVSAIQGFKMMSAQIAGKVAENELLGQKIIGEKTKNKWLDRTLGFKAFGLGYSADWRRMQNEAEVYSRLNGTNLAKSDYLMDSFGPGLSLMYDLSRVGKGFSYNRQNADLAFLRAGTALRNEQKSMAHWSAEQNKFYRECMQIIEKDILAGQLKLVNGQVNWQPTEFELRRKAQAWGIGLQAANTVINAAKTVTSIVNPLAGIGNGFGKLSQPNGQMMYPAPYGSQENYLQAMFGYE